MCRKNNVPQYTILRSEQRNEFVREANSTVLSEFHKVFQSLSLMSKPVFM